MKSLCLLIFLLGSFCAFADSANSGAGSEQLHNSIEVEGQEARLLRELRRLRSESGELPLQALPALDQLVNDYVAKRRSVDVVLMARAAFQIRLAHAEDSVDYYGAYRTYGDALIGAGDFIQAAEVYREGVELETIQPREQVNLLVALARLGLVDCHFLRWGTRSMIRANRLADLHGFEVPELLDLKFADLTMASGESTAARKIYLALWQAQPTKRQTWFSKPTLSLHRPGSAEGAAITSAGAGS
jgi:hypothetical protein